MGHIDQKLLPTAADVEAAVKRLKGVAVRTPLINAPVLDERLGARVFLKAEILQRTGSFKFRATIVMPDDAPKAKLDRTRALGAEVVTYDRAGGKDRAAIAERIVKE